MFVFVELLLMIEPHSANFICTTVNVLRSRLNNRKSAERSEEQLV